MGCASSGPIKDPAVNGTQENLKNGLNNGMDDTARVDFDKAQEDLKQVGEGLKDVVGNELMNDEGEDREDGDGGSGDERGDDEEEEGEGEEEEAEAEMENPEADEGGEGVERMMDGPESQTMEKESGESKPTSAEAKESNGNNTIVDE